MSSRALIQITVTLSLLVVPTACAGSDGEARPPSAATNSPAPSHPSPSATVHEVSGYPASRTLEGVLGRRDLDVLVELDSLVRAKPVKLAADAQTQITPADEIFTPYVGTVRSVLFGKADVGARFRFVVVGGTVGDTVVQATDEIAAPSTKLMSASKLVVGGQYLQTKQFGSVVEPFFAYSLDDGGVLTSLMSSASEDPYPSFTLEELRKGLAARAAR